MKLTRKGIHIVAKILNNNIYLIDLSTPYLLVIMYADTRKATSKKTNETKTTAQIYFSYFKNQ